MGYRREGLGRFCKNEELFWEGEGQGEVLDRLRAGPNYVTTNGDTARLETHATRNQSALKPESGVKTAFSL